jgi:hypothetical protein
MRVLVSETFDRWARREGLRDTALLRAATETAAGNFDADLGGFLFKKRIARRGEGKSGGYRTIIGFRRGMSERIVFLFGFAKNERDNIETKDLQGLSGLARSLLAADDDVLGRLVDAGRYRMLETGK